MAAQGMWTTPSDLMRLARAVNSKAAPEMLVGHPVEPRMGLGLFLNGETGHNWWSHSGSVRVSSASWEAWQKPVSPGRRWRTPQVLRPWSRRSASWYLAARAKAHSPCTTSSGRGIAAATRMNEHHLTAAGTYRLASGLNVVLTATPPDQWGQRSIELTLPDQPTVQLAHPFAEGQWRFPWARGGTGLRAARYAPVPASRTEVVARRVPR